MRYFIRFLYRLLVKNRLVRWLFLLSVAVYGVFYATEYGLAWRKTPKTRCVFSSNRSEIGVFSVKMGDNEVMFAFQDSFWLGVQNHVTTRVADSVVQALLAPLEVVHSTQARLTEGGAVLMPIVSVSLTNRRGETHRLDYLFEDYDTLFQTPVTWVRIDGQPQIFAAKGAFISAFNIDFDAFRDKKIWQFSPDSLASVAVYRSADTLIFEAGGVSGQWLKKGRLAPPDTALLRHIRALSVLSAQRFYDQSRSVLTPALRTHRLVFYLKNSPDSLIINYFKWENACVAQAFAPHEVCFWLDSVPLR